MQAFASTTIDVPAVDTGGKGILTHIEATATSGTGEIFVDIDPYISIDTQQSARTATQIAAQTARAELNKFDVYYKVVAKTQTVDGPSGGAALTLLAYAEFTKRQPRSDIVVTGTIERDGSIGQIGGIVEKTRSLKDKGVKLFLVPKGQRTYQGTDIVEEARAFGVQVVEVRNVQDLVKYAFTPTGSVVEAEQFNEQPLVLDNLSPPPELSPLKQIASEEISSLEGDLKPFGTTKEERVFKQSLQTTVNESKYALEKGYYYSAANSIFVARISFDTFMLRNTTEIDFMRMTQRLENEAKAIDFENESAENLEWVIGAKLRYYWAFNKLQGIKKAVGTVPVEQLYSEYVAAKSWVSAAKKMNNVAKSIQSKTFYKNQDGAREYAEKLVDALNRSQVYLIDNEVKQHYDGAAKALEKGDYATAVFDGLFSKSLAESDDKISKSIGSDLTDGLYEAKDFSRYKSSVWAEYYFIHALYSETQANRTNDFSFMSNAIKLQDFSEVLKDEIPYLKTALASGRGSKAISIPANPNSGNSGGEGGLVVTTRVTSTSEASAAEKTILLAALIALAVILLILLIRKTISIIGPKPHPLETAGKIEKIDDMLIHGQISERNWEILHARYLKRLRQEARAGETNFKHGNDDDAILEEIEFDDSADGTPGNSKKQFGKEAKAAKVKPKSKGR